MMVLLLLDNLVSPLRYYYFTLYVFFSVIIANLLTIIFIPIAIVFNRTDTLLYEIVFGIKLWTLL